MYHFDALPLKSQTSNTTYVHFHMKATIENNTIEKTLMYYELIFQS